MRAIASAAKRSRDEPPHRRLFRRRCSRGLSGGSETKAIPRKRASALRGSSVARGHVMRGEQESRVEVGVSARGPTVYSSWLVGQQFAAIGRVLATLEALDVGSHLGGRGQLDHPLCRLDAAASAPSFGQSISSTSSRAMRWPGASASSFTGSVARCCAHACLGGDRSRVHEHFEASEHPDLRAAEARIS